jgi:hypothetical protein
MNKKYLIDEENTKDINPQEIGFNAAFDKDIAKEVEVLDQHDLEYILYDYDKSESNNFPDYLKANNLLIVKIIE